MLGHWVRHLIRIWGAIMSSSDASARGLDALLGKSLKKNALPNLKRSTGSFFFLSFNS